MYRIRSVFVGIIVMLTCWSALFGGSGILYLCIHQHGMAHLAEAKDDHCHDNEACSDSREGSESDLGDLFVTAKVVNENEHCVDLLLDSSEQEFVRTAQVINLPKLMVSEYFQPVPFTAYRPISETWVIKPPSCGPPSGAHTLLPSAQKIVLRL